jgi:hypothetical protein
MRVTVSDPPYLFASGFAAVTRLAEGDDVVEVEGRPAGLQRYAVVNFVG